MPFFKNLSTGRKFTPPAFGRQLITRIWYPATCGPKCHGSGSAAAKTAVGFLDMTIILSTDRHSGHSRAPVHEGASTTIYLLLYRPTYLIDVYCGGYSGYGGALFLILSCYVRPEALIRAHIRLGVHPDKWKVARGVTILKPGKDDYSLAKSYRCISLLNCLGKMVEKVVAELVGAHCDRGQGFHPGQYGCRKGRSAVDAVGVTIAQV